MYDRVLSEEQLLNTQLSRGYSIRLKEGPHKSGRNIKVIASHGQVHMFDAFGLYSNIFLNFFTSQRYIFFGQADVRGHHVAVLCSNEAAISLQSCRNMLVTYTHVYGYVNTYMYIYSAYIYIYIYIYIYAC